MISKSTWILIAAVVTACCVGYALFETDDADAAVSFSDGTLNYESTSDSEAKVTGFTNDTVSDLTIPASYRYNGVDYAITEIGASAFDAKLITRINIGNVEKIGAEAFSGCVALTTVAGTQLTSIGAGAFAGCVALNTITLNNVTSVGATAFMGCIMLKSITMTKMLTIGAYAFYGSGLTSVIITGITANIGSAAFNHCSHLALMEVQGLRYTMKEGALYDRLTSTLVVVNQYYVASHSNYVVPSDVKKIADNAFDGCDELVSITIPESVTNIEDKAFVNCPNLRSVAVSGGTSYKSVDGCLYSYDGATLYFVPETFAGDHGTFVVPEGVTTIGAYAFSDCINLTEIWAQNVTEVKTYAFSDCKNVNIMRLNSDASFGIMSMDLGSIGNNVDVAVYAHDAGFLNLTQLNAFTNVTYMLPVTFELVDAPSTVVAPASFYAQNGSTINLSDITKAFPAGKTWETYVNDVKCETSTYTVDGTAVDIRFEFVIDYPFNAYVDDQEYLVTGPGKASIVNPLDGKTIPASITCDDVVYDVVGVILNKDIIMSYCCTEKYVVDPSSKYLMADASGVLYDKEQTILYRFPSESKLTDYTMPDTVKMIGAYAFSNCDNPTSLGISANLETIKEYAFEKCCIRSYVLPGTIKGIEDNAFSWVQGSYSVCFKGKSMSGVEFTASAFVSAGMSSMTKPTATLYTYDKDFTIATSKNLYYRIMPSVAGDTFKVSPLDLRLLEDGTVAVSRIDSGYSPTSLTQVTYGCDTYAVSAIDAGACVSSTSAVPLIIGKDVKSIGAGAFAGFQKFSNITVEEGCTACVLKNGLLLSADETLLIKVAKYSTTEVIIPETVTVIEAGALSGFTALKTISFPNSLATICEGNLDGLTFTDEGGNPLAVNVANFAGATFKSTDKTNFILDDGKVVVSFQATHGTVSLSSLRVEPGTTYVVDGNTIHIMSPLEHSSVTADAGYFFTKWTIGSADAPATGTVTGNMTFSAVCEAGCVLTFVADDGFINYDTVSVPRGTAFTVDGSTIEFRVGNTIYSAVATPNKEEHRLLTFKQWTVEGVKLGSGTFDKDMTIKAEFDSKQLFTISFQVEGDGSVDVDSVIVPEGTTYTANDEVFSINYGDVREVKATPGTVEHYDVYFDTWTIDGKAFTTGTVEDNTVVVAKFGKTLQSFRVNVTTNDIALGLIDGYRAKGETVFYGAPIAVDGNKLILDTTLVFTAVAEASKDRDISIEFVGFEGLDGITEITKDLEVLAVFEAKVISVPIDDKTATVDMSANAATFDETVMTQIKNNADSFVAHAALATITFDKNAISKISADTLRVEDLVPGEDPATAGAMKVLDIDFGINHDFSGGKLTVVIPLTIMGSAKVGYVNGSVVEDIPSTYDAEKKTVTFEVDHLSTFAVFEIPAPIPGDDDDSPLPIVIAVVVVLAIIAAVGVFLVKTGKIALPKKN